MQTLRTRVGLDSVVWKHNIPWRRWDAAAWDALLVRGLKRVDLLLQADPRQQVGDASAWRQRRVEEWIPAVQQELSLITNITARLLRKPSQSPHVQGAKLS